MEYVWISSRILRTRLELRPEVILEYQVSRVPPQCVTVGLELHGCHMAVIRNALQLAQFQNVRAVLDRVKNWTIDH